MTLIPSRYISQPAQVQNDGRILLSMRRPTTLLSCAGDVLTFCIAVAGAFVIHTVGDLPVANVILLALLPCLIVMYRQRLGHPYLQRCLLLLGLWFLGQIVTDVYRHTELRDWLRADARILFWGVDLLCLSVLLGQNARRQLIFLLGFAIGLLLEVPLQPTDYTDSWKFGYSGPATTGSLLIASYFSHRRWYGVAIGVMLSIASFHLALGYRAPVLFLFITAGLLMTNTAQIQRMVAGVRWVVWPLVLSGVVLLAVLVAMAAILSLSRSGMLGADTSEKNAAQAESKWGLLLGGRSEFLVSSLAVLDSPLVGHGGWARDQELSDAYREMKEDYGLAGGRREQEDELIPTHSHLMSAWVEAGICGVAFWAYLLYRVVKATLRTPVAVPMLFPLYLYSLVSFGWAILFSPPGGVIILPEAFTVILIGDLLDTPALRSARIRAEDRRATPAASLS